MKQGSIATKCITGLMAVCVLAYFGFQIYGYFADPIAVVTAYPYEVENAVTVAGYVVRDEGVLPGTSSGVLDLYRAEGERIGSGQRVATVYRDQEALERQEQADELHQQLEQLQYAKEAGANSEISLKLDSEITESILGLQTNLAADKLSSADEYATALRALVLKRDYTYADSADLEGELAAVKAQLKTLQAATSSGGIYAPRAGIYSAVVDGYETVLTPKTLDTLTPKTLAAIAPDPALSSNVGKLIYGHSWYFVTAMDDAVAKKLTVGDREKLRFAKGLDQDLEVRVASVGGVENGKRVVSFRSNAYISQMTLLRQQSADVIQSGSTGLRVPQNALRVDETGQSGVYCAVGMLARFKPVNVLYSGEGFCLIEAASEGNDRLRAGDRVVISSGSLYDGKAVE
ncbi:MAG: HlyD family efflux transporter periplasmic adaptor subunit [Oscillospiraceae bacterium]